VCVANQQIKIKAQNSFVSAAHSHMRQKEKPGARTRILEPLHATLRVGSLQREDLGMEANKRSKQESYGCTRAPPKKNATENHKVKAIDEIVCKRALKKRKKQKRAFDLFAQLVWHGWLMDSMVYLAPGGVPEHEAGREPLGQVARRDGVKPPRQQPAARARHRRVRPRDHLFGSSGCAP
jgi:hypothetical protein